jgi:thiol:disulfide interchange protein DsbD
MPSPFRLSFALILACAVLPAPVLAQGKITLEAFVEPADPFDPYFSSGAAAAKNPYHAKPGELVRLVIAAAPAKGFHTYPFTMRASSQDPAGLSRVTLDKVAGITPLWPIIETEAHLVHTPGAGTKLEHGGPFLITQEILIAPDAAPGPVKIPIKVEAQVCDDKLCVWEKPAIFAALEVTKDKPLDVPPEITSRLTQSKPDIIVVPVADEKTEKTLATGLISGSDEEYKASMDKILSQIVLKQQEDSGLLAFILAGVFWGFVSLITPCVFPMIPITVSYFLKQSEKEHHQPLTMAFVYCATIIVVLTLAAALLLQTFRWLSINPIMNYALGGLFIFFALSLFGMYDIELPSGLARFTSAHEGKGGYVGTVFMALTFTIISFACVAPFLGGFGGTAAGTPRPFWQILLGGLAFSTTFAAPFFVLALFPTLLRRMPKSGSWLNSVKVVMGFLELAAAFKFFRAAELVHSAAPSLFTFDFVLGIWVALCFLCGLYLIGVYRLPHDTPEESIGVPRLLFAVAFLGLGIYLLPALFKADANGVPQRPAGAVYAWVDSFLLPEARPAKGDMEKTGNLEYAVAKAKEERRKTGQPKRIFLDFTGKS